MSQRVQSCVPGRKAFSQQGPLSFLDKSGETPCSSSRSRSSPPQLALPFTWRLAGGHRSQSALGISSMRRSQTGNQGVGSLIVRQFRLGHLSSAFAFKPRVPASFAASPGATQIEVACGAPPSPRHDRAIRTHVERRAKAHWVHWGLPRSLQARFNRISPVYSMSPASPPTIAPLNRMN